MELAVRILEAEERELIRKIEESTRQIPLMFPHPVDETFWVDDYWALKGEKITVMDVKGPGRLDEAIFKSPSKNFTVTFTKDTVEVKINYDNVKTQTQVTGSFFSLIDEDEYVVGIRDHSFITGAKIVVEANEDLKFTRIYAKWNSIKWIKY
ncbi:MAG: hypothetical protein QXQ95_08790 [Thermofilum sp.]|uniref:hypothetical protein n=1 Tax=Thermofilum sp. TaxID=1961369 RepID=UPI003175410C